MALQPNQVKPHGYIVCDVGIPSGERQGNKLSISASPAACRKSTQLMNNRMFWPNKTNWPTGSVRAGAEPCGQEGRKQTELAMRNSCMKCGHFKLIRGNANNNAIGNGKGNGKGRGQWVERQRVLLVLCAVLSHRWRDALCTVHCVWLCVWFQANRERVLTSHWPGLWWAPLEHSENPINAP